MSQLFGSGAARRYACPPHVEPVEKVRPAAAYILSRHDVKEFPKY
jgi:hypothetical protein